MEIYLTTNLVNNKVYVGQTKTEDPTYLGSGTLIVKAIKKYGRENFSKHTLEIVSEESLLDEKEIFWIAFFKNRGYSMYNVQAGGRGWCREVLVNYWKRRKIEEHLQILKILQNTETLLCITSRKNSNKFVKIPLTTLDVINEWRGKRQVYQFDMHGNFLKIFENLDHVMNSIGYRSKGNLSMACNGYRNECGGYRWSYNEFPHPLNVAKKGRKKGVKDSVNRKVSHKTYTTKTIIQKDLKGNVLRTWNHAKEASEVLNLSRQIILRTSKIGAEYKGFIWEQGEKNVITEYNEK
jgi:hypothetical protein